MVRCLRCIVIVNSMDIDCCRSVLPTALVGTVDGNMHDLVQTVAMLSNSRGEAA